jgi:hypothetical protein
MTDEDIIKVWDGLDAEAFDADPRHYTMKLETGHLVARSGRDSGDRG